MSDKIKVLLLATNQWRVAHMRLTNELRLIREKIQISRYKNSFDLLWQPGARITDIGERLIEDNPDIIYFSGHGTASEGIILEDDSDNRKAMNVDQLTAVLRNLKQNLRLVIFNVCYSKHFAEALSQEVDYAIGMDETIDDEAAGTFAASFFYTLASGKSVNEAFQVASGSSGSAAPTLVVRERVNISEPFLFSKQDLERLKSTIKRLLEGKASDEDLAMLRQQIDEGSTFLDEIEETDPTGEGDQQKLAVEFHNHRLQVRLPSSEHKRALAQLFPAPPGIGPPFSLMPFIGREHALKDIKSLLKPEGSADRRKVIVVRGWPGVGKTTLVGRLGRDTDVIKMFPDGVLWNHLEQKPNLLSEMARWGQALGTDEILRAPTIKEATSQLAVLLRHRHMLLIVDDVWETAHATPFTQVIGEHCALLVTTRITSVANELITDEQGIYVLPVLTEDDALRLLGILAPAVVDQNQDECRELIRDLECLPLALHVAGSLLRSEARFEWGVRNLIEEIREGAKVIEEQAPIDRIEEDKIPTVSALLDKSTDILDEFTRDCFAYLGAFAPKPATFDLVAMQAVWEVDDARSIVRKLVGHGLLEPIGSGRFQMHRILVDHARSLCED